MKIYIFQNKQTKMKSIPENIYLYRIEDNETILKNNIDMF